MRDCESKKEGGNGKWLYTDVYWVNAENKVTFYEQLIILYSQVNNLLSLIRITIKLPVYINYLLHIGQEVIYKIEAITNQLTTLDLNLQKL